MKEHIYNNQQVLTAIKKLFSKEKVKEIQEILSLYGSQEGKGGQRVCLAVLKLSQGDEERLFHFLNEASIDFRDVLFWAEYDKNGKEIPNPYKELGVE